MKIRFALLSIAAISMAPGLAFAQDFGDQLKARQGQFRVIALNLGVVGGMARGTVDYDSELAVQAAENVATIARLHQVPMWPEGSDSMSIDGTRAMPSIWDDNADFLAKWEDMGANADALVAVAGNGQADLGPALGALGKTCGACHDAHREPSQ